MASREDLGSDPALAQVRTGAVDDGERALSYVESRWTNRFSSEYPTRPGHATIKASPLPIGLAQNDVADGKISRRRCSRCGHPRRR